MTPHPNPFPWGLSILWAPEAVSCLSLVNCLHQSPDLRFCFLSKEKFLVKKSYNQFLGLFLCYIHL